MLTSCLPNLEIKKSDIGNERSIDWVSRRMETTNKN